MVGPEVNVGKIVTAALVGGAAVAVSAAGAEAVPVGAAFPHAVKRTIKSTKRTICEKVFFNLIS
jgi:hypothetical protein